MHGLCFWAACRLMGDRRTVAAWPKRLWGRIVHLKDRDQKLVIAGRNFVCAGSDHPGCSAAQYDVPSARLQTGRQLKKAAEAAAAHETQLNAAGNKQLGRWVSLKNRCAESRSVYISVIETDRQHLDVLSLQSPTSSRDFGLKDRAN
jgi:hypothetical protein